MDTFIKFFSLVMATKKHNSIMLIDKTSHLLLTVKVYCIGANGDFTSVAMSGNI
jgi:hypothetical protein